VAWRLGIYTQDVVIYFHAFANVIGTDFDVKKIHRINVDKARTLSISWALIPADHQKQG
jgi:hypothetical protein